MFQWMAGELLQGRRLVAATILARSGSGPREPGAMMVLPEGGPARGTVGGGVLEARTLEAAHTVMRDGRSRLLSFDLSNPELSETGMVCGGRMDLLVFLLDGKNAPVARMFKKLGQALDSGQTACFLTSIAGSASECGVETGFALAVGEDVDWGSLDKRFRNLSEIQDTLRSPEPSLICLAEARCLANPVRPARRVYIAGTGHVGQALAEICSLLGYRVIVIDDRSDYACRERFPRAESIHVISGYTNAFDGINISAQDAIVIATRSHRFDAEVLAQALGTKAGFVGMIASRRKRGIIESSLTAQGFTGEDLARVVSPVGLDIGAKTPAEIAVSIAAQLIALGRHAE